jgi:general secretion pathway protein B
MSYILDALKKAEKERDLGNVPKLETVHDSPPDAGRRPGLWMVIGIGLLANAAVLAWWLWPEPRIEPAATAGMPDTPAVIAAQAPSPVASPSVVRQPVTPPPAPVIEAPATPMPATPAAPMPAPPLASAPSVPEIPAGLPSAPLPAPEPVADVPLLRDMPDSIRGPLAGLSIDVHVYADSPAERFVLVNMRKYREGEQLAAGPLLELITPQGMILRQHGQRFRVDR